MNFGGVNKMHLIWKEQKYKDENTQGRWVNVLSYFAALWPPVSLCGGLPTASGVMTQRSRIGPDPVVVCPTMWLRAYKEFSRLLLITCEWKKSKSAATCVENNYYQDQSLWFIFLLSVVFVNATSAQEAMDAPPQTKTGISKAAFVLCFRGKLFKPEWNKKHLTKLKL